ncbi:MAG: CDP-alcohol phosphatidyltransferase family protein [Lachnospiraceae bacterium]|nr:CDP-alcohol phosphatidyltransferase family protein [Lachnospiraceae bacterium]
MFVGKWNKSVILTYIGMASAVVGMFLAFSEEKINYAFCCLMISGVCDLFDGMVARRCKRTEEEKLFGIELDSLVDVISFIALPICIFIGMGLTHIWDIFIYVAFTLVGIARLAYYNIDTADSEKAIKYYQGLPVTYVSLIFPLVYLLSIVIPDNIFSIIFEASIIVIALLELIKVKIPKPKGAWYAIFGVLAIAMLVLYIVVV